MSYANLTILALFIFAYSIVSRRTAHTPFQGALVFTLSGFALGGDGLGILDLSVDSEGLRILAASALALVLFTDAAEADLSVLRSAIAIPRRLLLAVMPLKILMGYLCGLLLFPDIDHYELAILATMLAPTDAALGKAVVTNPTVPAHIRESLNFESGLNDGLAVPILFIFIALATGAASPDSTPELALELMLRELGIGLLVGLGMTGVMAQILRWASAHRWITVSWQQLPVVTMSLSCFGAAQWFHGSGFIAAFTGGVLFGWMAWTSKGELLKAAEGTADTLTLITWVVFGGIALGPVLGEITWQIALYSVLSLTVVRLVPVFICLSGTGLSWQEKLFVGWFGPRGLASIVFGVVVLNLALPGGDTVVVTAASTVLLSVVAHGVTANYMVRWLNGQMRRAS
ncbi:cation:proton antiporter [Microbulbifer yueqingensis]|uniref:NhaP-type Na+/H+ or K+/H+ antiporter n=1 Tax=Microbulbifer yueqingensis TaxID=658219 RepID=A0A1G8UF14_9GAMM|nr:cation:proton antiporter [Microbulbifer yueqingensis]SDJ52257.1 NhaP-type Na+/H+ or K+/H+ antiporter [Microbulbifer yueqingensis]